MSAAWAAFARTGNPNHADLPTWPAFDASIAVIDRGTCPANGMPSFFASSAIAR